MTPFTQHWGSRPSHFVSCENQNALDWCWQRKSTENGVILAKCLELFKNSIMNLEQTQSLIVNMLAIFVFCCLWTNLSKLHVLLLCWHLSLNPLWMLELKIKILFNASELWFKLCHKFYYCHSLLWSTFVKLQDFDFTYCFSSTSYDVILWSNMSYIQGSQ